MIVFGKIQSQLVYLLALPETYKAYEAERTDTEGSHYIKLDVGWPSQVQVVFEHIQGGDGSLLICEDSFESGAVYMLHPLRPPLGRKLFLFKTSELSKKQLRTLKKRRPSQKSEKAIVEEPLLADFYVQV